MTYDLNKYHEIWLTDFEFGQTPGNPPAVRCMVAKEFRSGRTIRLWADQLSKQAAPPFEIESKVLVVAYFATAEMNCFIALGWPLPCYVLDLYVEFRNMTNGLQTIAGNGLLGAMIHFGLDTIGATEKNEMRELALRGGSYTESEKSALLDYCETDVTALERLLPRMLPHIDLPRALHRGRYMKAVAVMETTGVPIDIHVQRKLNENWDRIKGRLIRNVDEVFGVFDGTRFATKNFEDYLHRNRISWPRLGPGKLALDDETFRSAAKAYPTIAPLHELRQSLGTMRLFDLPVGADGRNRCMLSPFSSRTGRNQPSNTKFPFGPSVWVRGLIRPAEGRSLAYVDWSQQEFGIAAALSEDSAMVAAYLSGDPYLAFAKQAGAVPDNASKESHKAERELFKQCALAVQYGMAERSLAERLGRPVIVGRQLLRQHRRTYPEFWKWSEAAVNCGLLGIPLRTVFGWTLHPMANPNPRSLANFPVQANGAEMMRLAAILATEQGIRVCAPVHDAFLIEAPTVQIETVATEMQDVMREASRIVLSGLELRSDVKYVHSPDRYMDERGEKMWETVMSLIDEIGDGNG